MQPGHSLLNLLQPPRRRNGDSVHMVIDIERLILDPIGVAKQTVGGSPLPALTVTLKNGIETI